MVVTFTEIRLRALSNCGHYRAVDIIVGVPTLSQKYDCGHYRIVRTIAGDLTQSQEYDCGHYRNVDSIGKIRLWALSECGHYPKNATVCPIGLWGLSECGLQGFCGLHPPGARKTWWSPQNSLGRILEPAKLPGGARKTPGGARKTPGAHIPIVPTIR